MGNFIAPAANLFKGKLIRLGRFKPYMRLTHDRESGANVVAAVAIGAYFMVASA